MNASGRSAVCAARRSKRHSSTFGLRIGRGRWKTLVASIQRRPTTMLTNYYSLAMHAGTAIRKASSHRLSRTGWRGSIERCACHIATIQQGVLPSQWLLDGSSLVCRRACRPNMAVEPFWIGVHWMGRRAILQPIPLPLSGRPTLVEMLKF